MRIISYIFSLLAFFTLVTGSVGAQTSACQFINPDVTGEALQTSTVSLRITNADATSINTSAIFAIPAGITPINLDGTKIWNSGARTLQINMGTFQPNQEKQILQDFRGRPQACIVYGTLTGTWSPAPQSGPANWNSQLNFSLIIIDSGQSSPAPTPSPAPSQGQSPTPQPSQSTGGVNPPLGGTAPSSGGSNSSQSPASGQSSPSPIQQAVQETVQNITNAITNTVSSAASVIEDAAETIRENKIVREAAPETTAVAATVGTVATAFSIPWWSFFQVFSIGAIGGLKKREGRSWGVVYDKATRRPIAGASVQLYESSSNKQKNVGTTDIDGRFGFLAPEGFYYLKVSKPDFADYQGSSIKVSGSNAEALNIEVGLESKKANFVGLRSFFIGIRNFFETGGPWLLLLGSLVSLIVWYLFPTTFNLVFLAIYLVLDIIQLILNRFTSRPYGVVTEQGSKNPIPLAVVRVYEARYNWLIGTFVTDRDGRFKFLVTPGNYYVTCAKPGFQAFQSQELPIRKADVIKLDISLASGGQ